MVGNVVVWKPSPMATYSSYIIHQIFLEAGVPPSVIQFVPGPPEIVAQQSLKHPMFAALNFTGSTFVFKQLWKDIASNMDVYKGYPKIVGETGGKNFHLVHESAEVRNAVLQAIRGAFEYQGKRIRFGYNTGIDLAIGQKCSALSRLYVSSSVWSRGFKDMLLAEIAKIKVGGPDDWSNYLGPVMFVFANIIRRDGADNNEAAVLPLIR
jgi:1-pyrroline-5-carboxylate dehydrogenase